MGTQRLVSIPDGPVNVLRMIKGMSELTPCTLASARVLLMSKGALSAALQFQAAVETLEAVSPRDGDRQARRTAAQTECALLGSVLLKQGMDSESAAPFSNKLSSFLYKEKARSVFLEGMRKPAAKFVFCAVMILVYMDQLAECAKNTDNFNKGSIQIVQHALASALQDVELTSQLAASSMLGPHVNLLFQRIRKALSPNA